MRWENHRPGRTPPDWWPRNHPWPPRRFMHRRRFLRRFGCMFLLLYGFSSLLLISILALVIGRPELAPFGPNLFWLLPYGIGILILLAVITLGTRGLRGLSDPLDEIFDAADRIAAGDYSTRVSEKGPREIRGLGAAFNSMAERLEAANVRRRNLMADVSHELRTPLTVIRGNVEGMLDGVYPADEARLNAVLEETKVLSRLIEDLRTMALAEVGGLHLKKEPADLTALVRETADAFRPQAVLAGRRLEENLVPLPTLNLDPGRMREVFENLLSNALRYAPEGGWIRITTSLDGSGVARRALVTVSDSGAGIPPADLPFIFDRFHKSGDSGGMGLGLSIAKYLVEEHSGTIRVSSRPGEGAQFSVSLPILPPDD